MPTSTGLKTVSDLNLETPQMEPSIPYPNLNPQCTFHVQGCIHTIPLPTRSEQPRGGGGHDCLYIPARVTSLHRTFSDKTNIFCLTGATTLSQDPSTNGSSLKKCDHQHKIYIDFIWVLNLKLHYIICQSMTKSAEKSN